MYFLVKSFIINSTLFLSTLIYNYNIGAMHDASMFM